MGYFSLLPLALRGPTCARAHQPRKCGKCITLAAFFICVCVCECACDNLSRSLYFMYYKRNDVLFNASVHGTTVFYSDRALSTDERAREREMFLLLLLPS